MIRCPQCGHEISQAKPKKPIIHFLTRHGPACGNTPGRRRATSTFHEHVTCGLCKRTFAFQKAAKARRVRS